jgi:DNA-binding XRE family transcriptional regulator
MNDERREPISLIGETADTVTLQRADYEVLLGELEDAEDRAAVLEYRLAKQAGTAVPEMLTLAEADRLIDGENPIRLWREKRGLTQRALAGMAGVSPSLLAEIEAGTKTGSVDTLRKLALELKVDIDTLVA